MTSTSHLIGLWNLALSPEYESRQNADDVGRTRPCDQRVGWWG